MIWPSPPEEHPDRNRDEAQNTLKRTSSQSQRALVSILSDAMKDCTAEEIFKKINTLCSKERGAMDDIDRIAIDNTMRGNSTTTMTMTTEEELQSDEEDDDEDDATSCGTAHRTEARPRRRSDEHDSMLTILLDLDPDDNDGNDDLPTSFEVCMIIEGMLLIELDALEQQQEPPFDHGDDLNDLVSLSKDSLKLVVHRQRVHHSSDMATTALIDSFKSF
jgi:hypothetical protein